MSPIPSARAFSLSFGITYAFAVIFDWPLFRYYPLVQRFSVSDLLDNSLGPAMSWYGWIATSALVGFVISVLIPNRWSDRLWPGLIWLMPLAMLIGGFYREWEWFL